MRLSGKTALITGSTSGIGRATAEAFAREGAEVIVSGRDEQRGAEVVAAITESGGSARFVRADLAAPASVQELARLVRGNGHGIDILVNNAGSFAFGPTESFPLAAVCMRQAGRCTHGPPLPTRYATRRRSMPSAAHDTATQSPPSSPPCRRLLSR